MSNYLQINSTPDQPNNHHASTNSFAYSAYSMASKNQSHNNSNQNLDETTDDNNININRSTTNHHHHAEDDNASETSDMLNSTIARNRQNNGGKNNNMITLKKTPHPLKKHRCVRYCFPGCRNFMLWFCVMSLIIGIVGLAAGPAIVLAIIRETVKIDSPYSPIFKYWLNPDANGVNTYRKLYLYNITNPYEIVLNGTQPNIVPIGPFVFKEVWEKDPKSIRWYVNGTMGYRYKYFMYFQPEMSIDEVTGQQLTDDKAYNVTILNGPMRGTLFRVGRLPETVVHVNKKFNITRQEVCLLLDYLVNNTILGPKGVFVQRTPHEVFFGYTDPIWKELHEPLALFDYNASTFFQAQWNGSAVAPSPYTYRSGMMCPLWQVPSECNNTGSDITLTVSGTTEYQLLESDIEQRERESKWAAQGVPAWLRRPGDGLLAPHSTQGEVTLWAGQLQGQWWWGPMRPGMDGGDEPKPDIINPPHQDEVDGGEETKNEIEMMLEEEKHERKQQQQQPKEAKKNTKKKNILGQIFQNDNNKNNQQTSSLLIQNGTKKDLFDPEACRKQYGTDGTRFSMPVKDDSILQIFSDFMGRTLPFTYSHDSSVSGVDTKRFIFNYEHGLRASDVNRFCYQMRMDGLINVSQFVFGDGLVSKSGYLDSCVVNSDDMVCVDDEMPEPNHTKNDSGYPDSALDDDGFCAKRIPFNNTFSSNFEESTTKTGRYDYDNFLKKYVLKDETIPYPARQSQKFRDHHESYVDVQPLTGTTLHARAGGLISLVLGPLFVRGCGKYLSNFTEGMPRTMIPYMRLDREAIVGGAVLETLKDKLMLLTIAHILFGLAIGVGVVGLVGIFMYQKRMLCWKNREVSTSSEDDEE